jgi:RimJ/RimL family protein N-acetyltransferase
MAVSLSTGRPGCRVRDWDVGDLAALVKQANNRNIARMLRDRFPSPYLESHGRDFLTLVTAHAPSTNWAITLDDEVVGAIGIERGTDVERVSAEIGYWLGESHWGQGIMPAALLAATKHAFSTFDLSRIFALPFAINHQSVRVLEKAGYVLEGRMRRSAIKEGVLVDQLMYATYR